MELSKEGKALLAEGCDVLSCHIRHGVDLKDSSVEASLRKAEAFFKEHYAHTKFRAFVCSSWLLYPPMQELLGEQSKIRQFASRFMIIAAWPQSQTSNGKNLFLRIEELTEGKMDEFTSKRHAK